MMSLRLCLVPLLIRVAFPQTYAGTAKPVNPAKLVVSDKMPLSRAADGVDGELQLMQDARLTASLKKELWATGDLGTLRNAVLRIVKSDGTLTDSAELEKPLAQLKRTRLYAGNRFTYLVTADYSAGAGSYSGPATSLMEINQGRIHWLYAMDAETGKPERLTLARTLKSVWKIVAAPDGSGHDILQALCRPTFQPGDEGFKLIYIRYHFDGKKWVRLVRERRGYSDFEEGFPDRNLFP
jgi:hypothetical protein